MLVINSQSKRNAIINSSNHCLYDISELPERFIQAHYNPSVIPGADYPSNLTLGANCQVYAYELLTHFGLPPSQLPAFRSSDLWDDQRYTKKIKPDLSPTQQNELEWLDLMLYNHIPDAFGAHVGVYIGKQRVLHLSQANGHPVIQAHTDLLSEDKYCYFIGAKRVLGLNRVS